MLGTLLKYEFKAVGRLLLPLYGAWLIAAVMLGLSVGNGRAAGSSVFMIAISGILYGTFAMVAVVLTCILLIQRFYKNLLGNEGYLMFTLPVSTGQHIINKIISGAVWGTAGIIVAILSGLLIAGCVEGFSTVFHNFNFMTIDIPQQDKINIILIIAEILIIILLAFAETAAKVYTAIAIGHQWNNHRIIGAIGAFIGLGIIETMILNIINKILDAGVADGSMSMTANMTEMAQVHITMLAAMAVCAVMAAIYGFIAWKLLDKRLNLE